MIKKLTVFILIFTVSTSLFAHKPKIVNLIDDFLVLMQKCKNISQEEHYQLWNHEYYQENIEILKPILFPNASEENIKEKVSQILQSIFQDYDTNYNDLEAINKSVQSTVNDSIKVFSSHFNDFDASKITFYFIVGVKSFNAKADRLNGENVFLLSAEWFHDLSIIPIIMQHEIFHLFHMDNFMASGNEFKELIYFPLLFEGCAVYYSEKSFPGSGIEKYVFTEEEDYEERCWEAGKYYLPLLLLKLSKPGVDDLYAELFKLNGSKPDYPDRCGYFLGYRIIRELSKTIPLKKIVRLKESEILELFRKIIKQIALEL